MNSLAKTKTGCGAGACPPSFTVDPNIGLNKEKGRNMNVDLAKLINRIHTAPTSNETQITKK